MRATGQVLVGVLLFSPAALGYTPEAYNPATDPIAIAKQKNDDPNRKWCHMYEVPNPKPGLPNWIPANTDMTRKECMDQCPRFTDKDNARSSTCGFLGGTEITWDRKKSE
jgi:hypothetical protein